MPKPDQAIKGQAIRPPMTEVLHLRMTRQRKQQLQRLAASNGIPTTAMINTLINEALRARIKEL